MDVKEFITNSVHEYVRDLLGDAVFILLSITFLALGVLLLFASITNSNILLGNPNYRDKSKLGEVEYIRTRRLLRFFIDIIGFILIAYNAIALAS